jgi:hypothetical protein
MSYEFRVQSSVFLKFCYRARTIADCLICFANRSCQLPIGLRLIKFLDRLVLLYLFQQDKTRCFFDPKTNSEIQR